MHDQKQASISFHSIEALKSAYSRKIALNAILDSAQMQPLFQRL